MSDSEDVEKRNSNSSTSSKNKSKIGLPKIGLPGTKAKQSVSNLPQGLDGKEGVLRAPGALVDLYSSHNKVQKHKVVTIAYGISGVPKLLEYDLRHLVRYGGIITAFTRGTILRLDDGVAKHMMALSVLAGVVACVMWSSIDDLKNVDTTSLVKLADYMNGFCPFVLGLYVSLALSRWWALRVQALGSVFDAVANCAMITACVLPGPEHKVVCDYVVKWGLASIFLLVKGARGNTDDSDMYKKGLLSKDEVTRIEDLSADGRAMVMWGWIMRLTQETFESARGPRPHAPKLMMIFNQCISARDGIQTIHTYLQTQLPFAYVHLLTLLVNVNNLVISIKCGAVFIVALANDDHQAMGYQVLMFLLVPVLYHGLLSISYVIHDPFGEDMLDFPIAAFVEYVAQCCDAVLVAQDNYPGLPSQQEGGEMGDLPTSPKSPSKRNAPGPVGDVEEGEEDFDAIGRDAVMMAAVESIREFTGAVSTELSIIGSQLKQLHDAVTSSETRRVNDAERLANSLLDKAQIKMHSLESSVKQRTSRPANATPEAS